MLTESSPPKSPQATESYHNTDEARSVQSPCERTCADSQSKLLRRYFGAFFWLFHSPDQGVVDPVSLFFTYETFRVVALRVHKIL